MAKPNFRSNAVSRVDLTSTLQRGAINRVSEIVAVEPRPPAPIEAVSMLPIKRQIDSRKKKLAHLKTLLEYDEKRAITEMLREIADVVGHNIQFSIFNRGLLLAALAQKEEFKRAAQKLAGLERPSNGDVEAFRDYEAQVGQLIFRAFDISGSAPRRVK
jgi:hypothetical protein